MELKPTDEKLLGQIYHLGREPLTKIAKFAGMSREQVDYRIDKYLKEGVIKRFLTVFNYSKLGYNCFAMLLLRFERSSSIGIFTSRIKNNKNCISWGKISGKYDIYLNLIFKNEDELNRYIVNILGSREGLIGEYLIIRPYLGELYPLKFLNGKERETFQVIGPQKEEIKLDKKELEILRMLNRDGRTRIIDIAGKLGISSELALYKLRRLYSKNAVLGSRVLFDMSKLRYSFMGILLHIKNPSEENRERIKAFSRNNPFVNSFALSTAKPNCFMQIFHKNQEELIGVLNKLKELLKDEPFEMDLILISDEEEINTLPFID